MGSASTPIYINSSGVPTVCNLGLGDAASRSVTSEVTQDSTALVTSGAVYTAINNIDVNLPATGSSSKPIYINSSGQPTACSYSIGTAASYGVTTSVSSGSSSLVTSGAVYNAINNSSSGFKGEPYSGSISDFVSITYEGNNKYTYTISREFEIKFICRSGSDYGLSSVRFSPGKYVLTSSSSSFRYSCLSSSPVYIGSVGYYLVIGRDYIGSIEDSVKIGTIGGSDTTTLTKVNSAVSDTDEYQIYV